MSRRRKLTDTTPFDTLRLEGTLFVPELLERAARGEAAHQKEADYAIPKGLKLHDEYGRAYRIATALWQDFAPQLPRTDLDAAPVTRAFVLDFLRQCLGYSDLALLDEPVTMGDRGFPISALALGGRLPVVIAPHQLGLDDPDARLAIHGSGARRKSAHQLAQEFLNADRNSLWAIVTNGRSLRLLRDAETLTRPNFLEFDLETILREGEDRYADFSALWRLLHASRAGSPGLPPTDCTWEKWKTEGHAQGLRVRDGLRKGVEQALLILGSGFLAHPANDALRQRLHDGSLTKEDYFQQLLRLIYRSLFLFCAEERDLLHTPAPSDPASTSAHTAARKAYGQGYSLRRLRNRSLRQSAHDSLGDLWQGQTIVFRALASGQPRLALPALGGLFAESQCPDLDSAALANRDLLAAMRHLRWSNASGRLAAIDYRNMGPEELGSVYESLLELVPQIDLPARTFGFVGITTEGSTSGNARKTTGSYYTPDSLVQELIKSALDPVIADRLAAQPDRPVEALLSITVCDPSCGSGHFLLAAARRLAEKLAELRAPDGAVRPDDYRHALREVASRCLYGVDINPMAVELCRVALWLETVDPGKPLGFLNHHIRTGNSLLGTTPDLIAAGLPDDTFTAIEGDDKTACAELKKRNKKEREGFGPLFEKEEQTIRDRLRHAATQIEAMDDSQPSALQQKEAAFTTSETAPEYRHAKLLADLWCAAFVIKKHYPAAEGEASSAPSPIANLPSAIEGHLFHTQDELFGQPAPAAAPKGAKKPKLETSNLKLGTASGITTGTLRSFVQGQSLPEGLEEEVAQLASQYRFFHWHLAFPQVFDQGGFDCLLGNPPWKMTEEDSRVENEASEDDPIADTSSEGSRFKRERAFYSKSGRLPLAARNRLQLARLFAELFSTLRCESGAAGMIIPSTITVNAFDRPLWTHWVSNRQLSAVWDFVNLKSLFQEVDTRQKFALICLSGKASSSFKVRCWLTDPSEISAAPDQIVELSKNDLHKYSGEELALPHFRGAKDLALLSKAIASFGRLSGSSDWAPEYVLLGATNDKDFTKLRRRPITSGSESNSGDDQSWIPVYEGKMVGIYDHRLARVVWKPGNSKRKAQEVDLSPAEKADPCLLATPLWEVPKTLVARLDPKFAERGWDVALCDVTGSLNERTALSSVVPLSFATHNLPLVRVHGCDATTSALFLAALASLPLDYFARLRVATNHLTEGIFFSLPVPRLASILEFSERTFGANQGIVHRVLELTYTAWDLEAFAADCGWSGPPFRWDEERRFLLRCELDAAFFHLYLGPQSEWQQQPEALTRAFPTPRHAVSYIMDTFPIVKRKDEAKYGHYRTQATILQIYDALGEAMQSGVPYQTLLNPPPADPACCHPPKD